VLPKGRPFLNEGREIRDPKPFEKKDGREVGAGPLCGEAGSQGKGGLLRPLLHSGGPPFQLPMPLWIPPGVELLAGEQRSISPVCLDSTLALTGKEGTQ
jgi:hypothetical protein